MRALGTVLAVLVLTIWSLATVFIDAVGKPGLLLAGRVETDASREFGYLAKANRGPMAQAGLAVCSRPAVRSLVSIKLAELEVVYRAGDALAWAPALADADQLLRAGVLCFPYDGNLWLRLAIVDFARTGVTPGVEQMLALSASTAPSEAWIVGPRIAFASRLSDLGSTGVRRILETDIRALVRRAHYAEVGRLYLQVGDQARQMFEESIAALDGGERRSELKRTLASVVKELPAERRP